MSSLTKESKNDASTAKNKASTGKSKATTNKKKQMIRKNQKRMKFPHHKDHLKMSLIGLIEETLNGNSKEKQCLHNAKCSKYKRELVSGGIKKGEGFCFQK